MAALPLGVRAAVCVVVVVIVIVIVTRGSEPVERLSACPSRRSGAINWATRQIAESGV